MATTDPETVLRVRDIQCDTTDLFLRLITPADRRMSLAKWRVRLQQLYGEGGFEFRLIWDYMVDEIPPERARQLERFQPNPQTSLSLAVLADAEDELTLSDLPTVPADPHSEAFLWICLTTFPIGMPRCPAPCGGPLLRIEYHLDRPLVRTRGESAVAATASTSTSTSTNTTGGVPPRLTAADDEVSRPVREVTRSDYKCVTCKQTRSLQQQAARRQEAIRVYPRATGTLLRLVEIAPDTADEEQ